MNDKLKQKDIKKSSSNEITHSIKKVKENEFKVTFLLVTAIIGVLLCSFYVCFSVKNLTPSKKSSSKILVEFKENDNGMKDVVNFSSDVNSYSSLFSITNVSRKKIKYYIYLEDYSDMIEFDECSNMLIEKDKLNASVDGSSTKLVSDFFDNGKFLLVEGELAPAQEILHSIEISSDDISGNHYHGKIVVKTSK